MQVAAWTRPGSSDASLRRRSVGHASELFACRLSEPVLPASADLLALCLNMFARRTTERSFYYTMYDPWPANLPTTAFTDHELKRRYGYFQSLGGKGNNLHLIPDGVPIKEELAQYEAWASEPIQLDRAAGRIGSGTYEDHLDVISRFFGFAKRWHGVPNVCLSLKLFTNQRLVLEFLNYVWQRSTNTIGMNNQVSIGEHARPAGGRYAMQNSARSVPPIALLHPGRKC